MPESWSLSWCWITLNIILLNKVSLGLVLMAAHWSISSRKHLRVSMPESWSLSWCWITLNIISLNKVSLGLILMAAHWSISSRKHLRVGPIQLSSKMSRQRDAKPAFLFSFESLLSLVCVLNAPKTQIPMAAWDSYFLHMHLLCVVAFRMYCF